MSTHQAIRGLNVASHGWFKLPVTLNCWIWYKSLLLHLHHKAGAVPSANRLGYQITLKAPAWNSDWVCEEVTPISAGMRVPGFTGE
jgi:hypothetical protein